MIKIWDNSVVRPLSLLFEKPFDNSYFPKLWKKSTIIPAHKKKKKKKKNEKLNVENYRPISLLPILQKNI